MAAQLLRLAELNDLETVNIRVLPFSVGLHHGLLSGPFVILRFPTNGDGIDIEPPTIYVEGLTGALYLDKPNEVERFSASFEAIRGSALDMSGSKSLLEQVARELHS